MSDGQSDRKPVPSEFEKGHYCQKKMESEFPETL